MKYCSQEMQPPQIKVITSSNERSELASARSNSLSSLEHVAKAAWPSAETYRRMISLGVNADFEETAALLENIPDLGLREFERVMLARSLLGIPVRHYLTVNSNGILNDGHEPGYEDF